MMKRLIRKVDVEELDGGCLYYSLVSAPLFDADGLEYCETYGIEVEFRRGEERESGCVEAIDVSEERVLHMLHIFADNALMPTHLEDVVEDMLDELLIGPCEKCI